MRLNQESTDFWFFCEIFVYFKCYNYPKSSESLYYMDDK